MNEIISNSVSYKIIGHDLQMLEIELGPNERVKAEPGRLVYMDQNVSMKTNSGDNLVHGLKRLLSGSSFFMTNFSNKGDQKAFVAFSPPYPGQIKKIDLNRDKMNLLCRKNAFLCAFGNVIVDMTFNKRLSSSMISKDNVILQRFMGEGTVFIHAGGSIVKKTLNRGEVLRVDINSIIGFEESIDFHIETVNGFKNTLFGGEGAFLAKLSGYGDVYIQSSSGFKTVNKAKITKKK
ncbi:TIGR00266 family protein [Thiotrichales bacterium 19S11-10]|nr:TIGR00266 family protein [Thiotrichales bacterium 19S11-10]